MTAGDDMYEGFSKAQTIQAMRDKEDIPPLPTISFQNTAHDTETYQQVYKDRVTAVTRHIDRRLLYKDADKKGQRFDVKLFLQYQPLDMNTPAEKAKKETALKQLCNDVPQHAIDAAWAWYAIHGAAEYDTDCDTIILAYHCLMGETEGAKQAGRRRNKNWHTADLLSVCKDIRKGNAPATQEEMFDILSRRAETWIDSETDKYSDITVWLTREGKKPHKMKLDAFKKFEEEYREQIGRKKKL